MVFVLHGTQGLNSSFLTGRRVLPSRHRLPFRPIRMTESNLLIRRLQWQAAMIDIIKGRETVHVPMASLKRFQWERKSLTLIIRFGDGGDALWNHDSSFQKGPNVTNLGTTKGKNCSWAGTRRKHETVTDMQVRGSRSTTVSMEKLRIIKKIWGKLKLSPLRPDAIITLDHPASKYNRIQNGSSFINIIYPRYFQYQFWLETIMHRMAFNAW